MFRNQRFVSREEQRRFDNTIWGKYLARAKRNSLLYFGVPCFTMMLVGLHFMTQFASVRYEQFDRRLQEVSQEDALKDRKKRKVDMKEEFYRLQQIDLDNWEQKRVTRLPGESDNKW